MNIKQIILTLIVLFAVDTMAISQVKKQYRDDVDKSTTIVIKENGANDLDILNSQFNLDDFKVNEQIKITTDQPLTPALMRSENVSGGQSDIFAPNLTSATASVTPDYRRPKTKMKRWSVRKREESMATKEIAAVERAEKVILERPAKVAEKPTRTNRISNAKKLKSGKYRKKIKKKKRNRKLKNRKRKVRRNKKGACYKF